jgi:hypothetical protein
VTTPRSAPSWDIDGARGFVACPLGVTKAEVRRLLGEPESVFRRRPGSAPIEDFQVFGAQVTYDGAARVSFVEVARPANPVVNGVELVGRAASDVYGELRAEGFTVREDDDGAIIEELNVGLYVVGGVVEAVSTGSDAVEPLSAVEEG